MKRFTATMLTFLLLIIMLSGCNQNNKPDNSNTDGKLSVVCTTFPQYDWVRQIIGSETNHIDLTLLMNNGVDLHNYQPTVDDIVKISTCDLLIYVGGESDIWVDDLLADATNPNMVVINLLDTLGDTVKAEEIVEGMENYVDEHEEEHGSRDRDEHVWLSLKNARTFCVVIADALSSLDVDNASKYKNNLAAYSEKLSSVDEEYHAAVDAASFKTLLFGDRFPFRYLADDYGIKYYAAFPGCSAETEASFDTIVFLAEKADELNLSTIMVTESTSWSIAKTIINNTSDKNQQILVLDAMQSVTASNVHDGTTYLSIMESNLNMLKEALR